MSVIYHDNLVAGTPELATVVQAGDGKPVTSGAVKSAMMHDLANIVATGTTNTTGANITAGTYFYLDGTLVRAKANIAVNATFTSGTNYETVTNGGLNSLGVQTQVPITSTYVVSSASSNQTWLFQVGKLCVLKVGNFKNLTADTYVTVATLPNGVAPSSTVTGAAVFGSMTTTAAVYANGELAIYCNETASYAQPIIVFLNNN